MTRAVRTFENIQWPEESNPTLSPKRLATTVTVSPPRALSPVRESDCEAV